MVAAVLRTVGELDVDLAGVAATMAVAVAAWTRTRSHADLAEAYAVTAKEVREIGSQIGDAADEAQWAQFVVNAEQAFSREHTVWHARRRTISPV